jgi:N-acetylmuramoyl-L-alanine amidase
MNGKPIPLLLAAAALAAQTAPRGLLQVSSVRHWSLAATTRVVIEVSGEFQYRTERLHNPERVFYDIQGARPNIESRRVLSQAVGDKLLDKIRVAETQPGVTRVVLDLAAPADVTASQLANPNRLVLELRLAAGPAPPAETRPPEVKAEVKPKAEPVAEAKPSLPAPPEVRGDPATAAKRTSLGRSSLIRALGLKVTRVVLDPGHGGQDQGTAGTKGLLEKDLVLDVALKLGKLIEDRMGAEVVYTRTEDTFVPLEGRTALANEKKADLFLSIHANSSPLPRIGGAETFYLNFTDSKDALDVAARENASAQKTVHELQDIIQRITRHEKSEESREFAGRMQAALFTFAARALPGVRNRGVKKAPFVVLVGAQMPSVLCEIGFLSNPREETLLKRTDHRQKLAEALYRGLSRYAEGLSHFQMALGK